MEDICLSTFMNCISVIETKRIRFTQGIIEVLIKKYYDKYYYKIYKLFV